MGDTAALVRRFYGEMWNRWDETLVPVLLAADIEFRGSIGLEVKGRDGFVGYMRTIRAAFPDFRNEIVSLIAEDSRAAARLEYTGTHRGEILGRPPTGRRVAYAGAAFFDVADGRISKVWVLGDVTALVRQISDPA